MRMTGFEGWGSGGIRQGGLFLGVRVIFLPRGRYVPKAVAISTHATAFFLAKSKRGWPRPVTPSFFDRGKTPEPGKAKFFLFVLRTSSHCVTSITKELKGLRDFFRRC